MKFCGSSAIVTVKLNESPKAEFDPTNVTSGGIICRGRSGDVFISINNGDERILPDMGNSYVYWLCLNSLHPCTSRHVASCNPTLVEGSVTLS